MEIDDPAGEIVDFARTIGSAKTGGAPWFEIARLLQTALADPRRAPTDAPRIRAAAQQATGLSAATLRRFTALSRKVGEISARENLPLTITSFNALESAVRLYERSPELGRMLLVKLARGDLTLAEVRGELQRFGSRDAATDPSRPPVRDRRRRQAKQMSSALARWADGHPPGGGRIEKRPRLTLATNQGYDLIGVDGGIVAGVDFMFPDARLARDDVEASFASTWLLAPFFSQFFICFADAGDDAVLQHADELLEWFDAYWVGILALRDGNFETIRKPPGFQSREKTHRYEALKRRFAIRDGRARSSNPHAFDAGDDEI